MGFVGVYTAVYDYQPQAEGELDIREGDLLYVLENSAEDDWWKVKKKADQDDEEEPIGLVPNNYLEEAQPINKAKALYDYTRQTDEEVSFSEDTELVVYDISDPDWILVGLNSEYGFAPSNYIQLLGDAVSVAHPATPVAQQRSPIPQLPQRRAQETEVEEEEADVDPEAFNSAHSSPVSSTLNPAAAIAGILHKQLPGPPPPPSNPPAEPEEEEAIPVPALPQRPPSQIASPVRQSSPLKPSPEQSPPSHPQHARIASNDGGIHESPPFVRVGNPVPSPRSPSGYHIYNISEMVSVMGKRKKMPTTLGINIATGTIFMSPENSGDAGQEEWTADKLTHYSIEGKHIFLDLVRPSRNIDFHAGAKDTAQEIVSALGEIAGVYRAEGLREVIAAGQGGQVQRKGQVLYDFMAQGDDEVTVAVGDEVIVLDNSKSEEWWMVRRLKNGREGVVPSSYVEISGIVSLPPSTTGINAGRSTVEQNRLEEERLAKEAARKSKNVNSTDARTSEVGPGVKLPERRSSLVALSDSNNRSRHKRDRSDKESGSSRSKPDPIKTRNWIDRTGTFSVDAQFIGIHDGKIHLHKVNGVKIAVPVSKMSVTDLEYVEKVTGKSLDEDKPLSDIRRKRSQVASDPDRPGLQQPPEYDWFDFFLKAGVGPHQCGRYAQNFAKDSMDESVLPDISPETLRTLGLKEGDILRVMRYLDTIVSRPGAKTPSKPRNVSFGGEEVISGEDVNGSLGGLFTGPGGALRNNTRKSRPAPATQTSDPVDPSVFAQKIVTPKDAPDPTPEPKEAPSTTTPVIDKPVESGFDDDAWAVKPPKSSTISTPISVSTTVTAAPSKIESPKQASLAGAMVDLSLLQAPLEPTTAKPSTITQAAVAPVSVPAPATATAPIQQPQNTAVLQPLQQAQVTGANPSFFAQLGPSRQQISPQALSPPVQVPMQGFLAPQPTGFQTQQPQQLQQFVAPRQRPQPPQTASQNSLLPPPPQRPLSAPQNVTQQNSFAPPPLQPQLTGLPQTLPQVAPPGQSLTELNQLRFQLQPQSTGFGTQFQSGPIPQPTGFPTQTQSQLAFPPTTQQQPGIPGLAPQPTGFGSYTPQQPLPTGMNSVLSPPLQPQQPMPTGINSMLPPHLHPQPTGPNGFGNANMTITHPPIPPIPPIPQQPTITPLQPQKTGPPPPVRFGVKKEPAKIAPQPTGLRANLSQATPTNPFGFY